MTTPLENTPDCFMKLFGKKLTGVVFNALPHGEAGRNDRVKGTKTLLFENGEGITVYNGGFYRWESSYNISVAIKQRVQELRAAEFKIMDEIGLMGDIGKSDA